MTTSDPLLECVQAYERLLDHDYYFKLENGLEINTFFAQKHFYHLLGLNKLTDIAQLNAQQNTPTTIYKNIRKSHITYSQIAASVHFNMIKDRMENFTNLNDLIFEKAVIDFDKTKLNSSKLKSTIILYQEKAPLYLHLCLAPNAPQKYYPETFLVQKDDYYLKNQVILKVVDFKAIEHPLSNNHQPK